MNTDAAKYARIEYARRFLVAPDSGWKNFVQTYSKRHEDKYLSGTRLRLRVLTDSDSGRQLLKLTKKYRSESPYFRQINTILLTADEYRIFDRLDGKKIEKTRYYHRFRDRVFSIDVFENALNGLLICETEQPTLEDLMQAEPPAYVTREVTEDAFFTGVHLSQTTAADLTTKLASSD